MSGDAMLSRSRTNSKGFVFKISGELTGPPFAMIRLALACLVGTAAAVVPLPLSFELHPGSLDLAEGFAFRATGPPGAQSPTLAAALARFGSSLDVIGGGVIGGLKGCAVEVKSQSIELGTATDESYHLVVAATPSPICSISAANVFGAMHAMETFVQLVDRGGGSGGGGGHPGRMRVPLATVSDRPRFPLRGTMIDTSRHFLPVENILLHLDAMSCTKMNLLHWHLVDSQSWPYVSMAFPRLAEHGAYGTAISTSFSLLGGPCDMPYLCPRDRKLSGAYDPMLCPIHACLQARSRSTPRPTLLEWCRTPTTGASW